MSKIKIDLNKQVTLLDGSEATEHLWVIAANALNEDTHQVDAMKVRDRAFTLHAKKPLELDKSDLNLFKEIIERSTYLRILPKGEILEIISSSK